ncbi:hypothetical protein TWF751_002380 [Orbilia oligospora]|nr:hypothetical protein TWF751_002380 [Orbilia oligospora]
MARILLTDEGRKMEVGNQTDWKDKGEEFGLVVDVEIEVEIEGPSIKACICPVSRRQAPWACAVMLTANLFDFQIQLQTQLAVLHDIT